MPHLTMEPKAVQPPVDASAQKAGAEMTVADFVLQQLASWGVKRIYGVIGDANLCLLDAMAKQNQIAYVACCHEESAALMASAEAKLTGRVSVCLATSGPGIANMINGLADAAMDYAPVLALTGQVETAKIGTRAKQYIDQQKLLGSLTDCSELVAHPEALPELLQSALTAAVSLGRLAHLSLPKDLYTKVLRGNVRPYPKHLHQQQLTPPEQISEAAQLLIAANKPLLLLGRGAKAAPSAVQQLAEALSAAVVTTLPARPVFPNDHELYAGGLGQGGSETTSVLMAEADLIVMLGATWWPDDYVPTQSQVLQIDKTPAQIGQGHPLAQGVVGDIGDIVPRLLEKIRGESAPDRSDWRRRVTGLNEVWRRQIEAEAGQGGTPLAPQSVIRAISAVCVNDAVLAVDTGDHTLWFNRIFQTQPQQDILLSGRWRTLGFALPAAVAAKLAQPQRQVIAIAGDGGCVQTIMELHTAVLAKTQITLVVMNNGCYAMEKNRMEAAGLHTLGSELLNPDFVKLAEACGAAGYYAETVEQLEEALHEALAGDIAALIEVKTAAAWMPHTKI